ncbi:hypothetical protein BD779DRAFT_1612954 [Infundibulicybe gibba]|nr:hypothetical protein BD779DRAFT_1612954 [Infundibulicybe gibba]
MRHRNSAHLRPAYRIQNPHGQVQHPINAGLNSPRDNIVDQDEDPISGSKILYHPVIDESGTIRNGRFPLPEKPDGPTQIDELMSLWAATLDEDATPPFADHLDLYSTLDDIKCGDLPWSDFSISFKGDLPNDGLNAPPWMTKSYDVWYRNPRTFNREIDYAPLQEFGPDGKRVWSNLMSGNWAWQQADKIAQDPKTHSALFVPVILGSDKTTVSVATGQNDYYPLYASLGNVHNNVRRAHRGAVSIIGFLSVTKADRQYAEDPLFRRFRRQLFHESLCAILEPLRKGMTTPEIVRCPDGHLRRVIYGLGPYIADYPEQVLLGCIAQGWCAKCTAQRHDLDGDSGWRSNEHTELLMESLDDNTLWSAYGIVADRLPFTSDFPRADIHELLAPDLLHQIIKGTFKDHLVTWVGEYLTIVHGAARAAVVMADIDRRIAAVPSFPGLRRFPDGRGFKQWTGDDSKALMKVYLPAISGHVPPRMVRALSAFLDFCYLVRRNIINEATLDAIDDALARFHRDRIIFEEVGVRSHGFSLPRQHSMMHYRFLIEMFGAPNGLCSSITESKHIKAVKEPWRRSSHFHALGQMLTTNQRLDKLAAARSDFKARGMLFGPCLAPHITRKVAVPPPSQLDLDVWRSLDDVATSSGPRDLSYRVTLGRTKARKYPANIGDISRMIGQPHLHDLIHKFLLHQLYPNAQNLDPPPIPAYPKLDRRIDIYHSAVATYYAPSDHSGINGMLRQRIRATPVWRHGPPRRDCIFIEKDDTLVGMRGLHTAQVLLFFSCQFRKVVYPCALVRWFLPVSDMPCEDTGMWVVEPELNPDGSRALSVIHLDCVLRSAHLIGFYGEDLLPPGNIESLEVFERFYISKYSDHQAHELAF